MEPTQKPRIDRIIELFDYNPETGDVSRKMDCGRGVEGFVFTNSSIKVDGQYIRITHVIWVIQHGSYPPKGYWVDHKNGIKADNRLSNLRLATPTQNQQNKSGYATYSKGVTWRDRIEKPWQAKIRVNGERLHLGSFATQEEAAEAYRAAAKLYHGEFARYD